MTIESLDGATVVITGASSGIGRATAEAFARAGARLVLAARGADALERVAEHCRKLGADAIVVPTDVTDAAQVHRLAEQAIQFGRTIDVWVSNVGIGAVGRFEDVPIAAHEQVIRANLIGHVNDAHAALPVFLRQRSGIFINMISMGGFAATPYAAAYSASKFGLRGLSDALRAELADQPGIRICDVYPALVDTPGLRHGANYTGRALVTGRPPALDPRGVADAIVALSLQPRDTTVLGAAAHLARLGQAVAPALSGRMMARFMARHFRKAPPAPITDGNLFAPPDDDGAIDGGLRSRSATTPAVAGIAAVAGVAVLAMLLRPKPAHGQRISS